MVRLGRAKCPECGTIVYELHYFGGTPVRCRACAIRLLRRARSEDDDDDERDALQFNLQPEHEARRQVCHRLAMRRGGNQEGRHVGT